MAVVYYTQQDEYDLVNSGQDCIGWTVVDQSGMEMGKVTEMLINTDTEMVDSILIDRNKRVPAQDFQLRDNRVVVRGMTHDDLQTGSAAAAETHNQPMPKRTGDAKHVAGVTRAANEGEIVLRIIEEQLAVSKRTIESGGAHVRTKITEKPVEETVTLREEHVTVERHQVDRPVDNAPAAFKEGTIEVTEMAEVPVVAKQLRVVEEVVVGKEVIEHTETIRDTVKRTDVDVLETDATADRNRRGNS